MGAGLGSLSGLAPPNPSGIAEGTGTGPHGVVAGSSSNNPLGIGSVVQWLKEPFTTPLDPMSLFLIVGVILVSIIMWNFILFHIRLAAETI
jgi:hypothetical protein